jgi:arylsulfatase A-like enzyme
MFMQWPAHIPQGLVFDSPVSQIDLFPTLLGASTAGGFDSNNHQDTLSTSALGHLVANIDGVNLLPFIANLSNKEEIAAAPTAGVNSPRVPHKSIYFRSGHYSAIRVGHWKLQVCGNPEKMWLFDLEKDPSEANNLASFPEYAAKLNEMLEQLNEVAREQSDPLWPAMTETAVHIDKLFEFNESLDDEYIYWPN